jgi:hypothetical protein
VLALGFRGYDHGCPFDDVISGSRHFTDFERIAFVADECPFRRAVAEVADLIPTDLRVFGLHELEAAKIWLADRCSKGQAHLEAGHHGLSAWLSSHISQSQ